MNFEKVFGQTDCWKPLFKQLSTASIIMVRKTCSSVRRRTQGYNIYRHATEALRKIDLFGAELVEDNLFIISGLHCLGVLNGDPERYDSELAIWKSPWSFSNKCDKELLQLYQRPFHAKDASLLIQDNKNFSGSDIWNKPEAFVDSLDLEYARCFIGKGKVYISCIDAVVTKHANVDITKHYVCQRLTATDTKSFINYIHNIARRLSVFQAAGYQVNFYLDRAELGVPEHLSKCIQERTNLPKMTCELMAYVWNVYWTIYHGEFFQLTGVLSAGMPFFREKSLEAAIREDRAEPDELTARLEKLKNH
jgi:hypothetical protein